MDRSEIESALRAVYAARAANNVEETKKIFAPGAIYRVAGHAEHCPAVRTAKGPEIEPALQVMYSAFKASRFDIESIQIEGNRASVLCRAVFKFTPTGETVDTELAHFWAFEGGKVVNLIEFFDTARVTRLMSPTPA